MTAAAIIGKRPEKKSIPQAFPSKIWWMGASGFWSLLNLREKRLFVFGIFLPGMDQIARLGSFGVAMRVVSHGVREVPAMETRVWMGLIIFAAFGIAALIQFISESVKLKIKKVILTAVRRCQANMIASADVAPSPEREIKLEKLLKHQNHFLREADSAISAIYEFAASSTIVVLLLMLVTWFSPLVGTIMIGAGVIAVLVLLLRSRKQSRVPGGSEKEWNEQMRSARRELKVKMGKIAEGSDETGSILEELPNNKYDKIMFRNRSAKVMQESKLKMMTNLGGALILTVTFFVVTGSGTMDESRLHWLIIFIMGLRLALTEGKTAIKKWVMALRLKGTLLVIARNTVR